MHVYIYIYMYAYTYRDIDVDLDIHGSIDGKIDRCIYLANSQQRVHDHGQIRDHHRHRSEQGLRNFVRGMGFNSGWKDP